MGQNLNLKIIRASTIKSLFATFILLGLYFGVLTTVSGWSFAQYQFSQFWYFIFALAAGFGLQVGLYTYLNNAIKRRNASAKVLAVSGTTSTAAMISCCAHYLVNLLPILGVSALITVISQYQVRLFWVGLAFNLAGIIYMFNRLIKYTKPL